MAYYKGLFRPNNPQKYDGDPRNIVYRSRWENRFMSFLDSTPDVIKWSSEEFFIQYKCKTDGRFHRYFPDFKVTWKKADGSLVTQVIEIKPKKYTEPPKKPKKMTRRYINEAMTYAKNTSKWEYSRAWCKDRGYQFLIMTEKELGL